MSHRAAGLRWLALLSTFLVVHAAYWAAGIRFDSASLHTFMQYLDPELLRTRLVESLWYLHIQPPIFNLYIGIGLKLDPACRWFFQATFLACGFTLYACTYLLQRRLGVRAPLAFVLATLFMASPGFILWEHFLLYEFPCAALLALSALLLWRLADEGKHRWAWALFFCIFLIAGMRSLFHLAYLPLVGAALLAARPRWWRALLPPVIATTLLLGGFYAKNYLLFGQFTACTFVQKNFWIMTAGNIGWDEKVRAVDAGHLSPLVLINRWADLAAYPPEYAQVPARFRDIPVLNNPKKSTGGENYNHYGNIAIAKVYGDDAWQVFGDKPQAYLAALALSTYRYFAPTSSPPVSPQNKDAIGPMLWFYDQVLALHLPDSLRLKIPFLYRAGTAPYLSLHLGLPLVTLYGCWLLRPLLRRTLLERRLPQPSTQELLLGFLLANILLVAILGCALDFHETPRYRFLTNAFHLALAGLLLENLLNTAGNRIRGKAGLAHDTE